jgi:hypothetical protein
MRSFTRLDARSRFAIGVDRKEDGMTVLSVMAIKGDPRQLVAGMKEKIEPIARRKAAQYGAISSTIVRTDDGIKIFNLWKTEEGRHKMAARSFMVAFPDMQVLMDGLAVLHGNAEYRWTLVGTNTGPGGTGRRVRISGFEEWTIGDDGLIAAPLGHYDQGEYDRQLEHGVELR